MGNRTYTGTKGRKSVSRRNERRITAQVFNPNYSWRCICGKWNAWNNVQCWSCGGRKEKSKRGGKADAQA